MTSQPRYLNLRGSLPTHTPQSYHDLMHGKALTADEILALCVEHGITDTEVVLGRVWAFGAVCLETAQQVERLAAWRAATVA